GSAKVDNAGLVSEHRFFVALDLQERQGVGQARAQTKVRSLIAIQDPWLFDLEPSAIRETEELSWDNATGSVVSRSRLVFDALTLAETRAPAKPSRIARQLLLKAALGVDSDAAASLSIQDWISALAKLGGAEALEA